MQQAIKAVHDSIEDTKLAKCLADGTVSASMYREYLRNSLEVWTVLESKYPLAKELGVCDRLQEDLYLSPPDLFEDESVHTQATKQAMQCDEHDLYVLGLGLCYGGKQMANRIHRLQKLPVTHFAMPKDAIKKLRGIATNSRGIQRAFQKTLAWYHDVT